MAKIESGRLCCPGVKAFVVIGTLDLSRSAALAVAGPIHNNT